MLELVERRLTLVGQVRRSALRGAQAAGNVGLVETLRHVIVRVRHVVAERRVVLPAGVVAVKALLVEMVVVIDVDIDIVVPAAMVAAVIPVIVVMIVIVPVDAAEQRIGGGYPQAETKTVDEAIGKLFARRWRQIDRRVSRVRPGAINLLGL